MKLTTLTLIASTSVLVTGCATSLQSLPAAKIAGQAVRAPDGFTGLTQTQLPAIAPFKAGRGASGKARLLSAESFQGQTGGAWMDVSVFYDTPGQSEDQMRSYKTLNWAGGETAVLADFAASLASCEERVTQSPGALHYGRRGFGGFGSYGFGSRNHYRPNHRPVSSDHSRPTRPHVRPTSPTSRPNRPTTSRPTPPVTRPTSPSTRPTTSRPRPPRTVSRPNKPNERRDRLESRFQNADLAAKAAPKSAASGSRLRLAPVSPFRRGYNYGYYDRGFGGYGSDYVIKSACGRVEKLRIFVPANRLETAERYGLTLFARSESGDERTIVLPANYVMAYQMAAGAQMAEAKQGG